MSTARGTLTIATAADRRFGFSALNLVGSIHRHEPEARIIVHDLGLTRFQRFLLRGLQRVQLAEVPAFVPWWQACWSWKSWLLASVAEREPLLLYLDAGTTVLAGLEEVVRMIEEHGYFLISRWEPMELILPADFYATFRIPNSVRTRPVIDAAVVGVKRHTPFYREVVQRAFELTKQGYTLGWSRAELWRNRGPHRQPVPIVRDCALFRHDQTLLGMLTYLHEPMPVTKPEAKIIGWRRPADDAGFLIWHHRGRSWGRCWLTGLQYVNAHRLKKAFLPPLFALQHARVALWLVKRKLGLTRGAYARMGAYK
jgi:hypothetical protein